MKYDFLIVGAGLFGSVCARELTDSGFKCLVIDKRPHIGGNCYTEKRENINVHVYGPHIFHTSDEKVWNYVNRFIKFNNYRHHAIANYKDEIYSLPFNMFTFNKLWNLNTPDEVLEKIKKDCFEGEPQNLEEQAISQVGREVYEKLIKGYTTKQWKKEPKDLPPFIIKRLPVRLTFDNNYFFDKYQGIPTNGYTELFEKLLKNIDLNLGVDYLNNKEYFDSVANNVIYTGPIDKFYNYEFGSLEYLSMRFEHEVLDKENYQGTSIVNYTDIETPFTRSVEHKHFENSKSNKTIVTKEYSENWDVNSEPFYPINDELNQKTFEKYSELSKSESKVYFGGRLAEYKYYDMDKVIGSALKLVNKIKGIKTLIVHNPCNEMTKNYRDYNLFFDDLTEELKRNYDVIENRYFENAHTERMKISLKKGTDKFLEILECEYVIEDEDSGDFWILSVSEQISMGIISEQNNKHLKKVLYSQYIPENIFHHTRQNCEKYHPWIFFPQEVIDLEPYYEKRKIKKELIPKLFFKGGTFYRPIVNHIDKDILSDNERIESNKYFDTLIDYDVCLSVGGVANGDLCYRDIECMALGVPILRFDFVTTMNPPLIPNYHYISIPLQLDLPKQMGVLKDRLGEEKHGKLIEDRFNEVIKDKEYLRFVSKNAREYYEKYLSRKSRVHHTLNLLNLS